MLSTRYDRLRAYGRALRPVMVLPTLALLVFVSGTQVVAVAPLLPRIGVQLGVREALLGTIMTADAVLFGLVAFGAGPVSDTVGRRRVLLAGVALLAIALLAHAAVVGYRSLLLVRAAAGVGGGMLSSSTVAYLADAFGRDKRGGANGWLLGAFACSQVIGVPIATILGSIHDFRTPFILLGLLGVATWVMVHMFVAQPPIALAEGPLRPADLVGRHREMLRRRDVLAAAGVYALVFGASAFFLVYLPGWLVGSMGAEPRHVALLFCLGGAGFAAGSLRAVGLARRVGRRRVFVSASMLAGLAIAVTTLVARNVALACALFAAVMALQAARIGPLEELVASVVSADRRGTLVSLVLSVGQVAFGAGSAAAGFVVAGVGFGISTGVAAVMLTAGALLAHRVMKPPPPRLPDDDDNLPERRAGLRASQAVAAASAPRSVGRPVRAHSA